MVGSVQWLHNSLLDGWVRQQLYLSNLLAKCLKKKISLLDLLFTSLQGRKYEIVMDLDLTTE